MKNKISEKFEKLYKNSLSPNIKLEVECLNNQLSDMNETDSKILFGAINNLETYYPTQLNIKNVIEWTLSLQEDKYKNLILSMPKNDYNSLGKHAFHKIGIEESSILYDFFKEVIKIDKDEILENSDFFDNVGKIYLQKYNKGFIDGDNYYEKIDTLSIKEYNNLLEIFKLTENHYNNQINPHVDTFDFNINNNKFTLMMENHENYVFLTEAQSDFMKVLKSCSSYSDFSLELDWFNFLDDVVYELNEWHAYTEKLKELTSRYEKNVTEFIYNNPIPLPEIEPYAEYISLGGTVEDANYYAENGRFESGYLSDEIKSHLNVLLEVQHYSDLDNANEELQDYQQNQGIQY